jgi:hypothetical protein
VTSHQLPAFPNNGCRTNRELDSSASTWRYTGLKAGFRIQLAGEHLSSESRGNRLWGPSINFQAVCRHLTREETQSCSDRELPMCSPKIFCTITYFAPCFARMSGESIDSAEALARSNLSYKLRTVWVHKLSKKTGSFTQASLPKYIYASKRPTQ